jgi:hypothetical protein
MDQYDVLSLVGEGQFGKVYKVPVGRGLRMR